MYINANVQQSLVLMIEPVHVEFLLENNESTIGIATLLLLFI